MYPTLFTTPGVRQFAEEVDAERQRQITKFGDQHHPDGTGAEHYVGLADEARKDVERFVAQHSGPEWSLVLLEEVYEALAESDPAKLRAELVQVAALCAAWVADIDSRTPSAEQPAACAKCRTPFDPADTRFDGRAQRRGTPYCRWCVDRCRDNEIADHRCVICA
ncbi:hypothetical protein [Streptomyces sp. NPDC052114]|uniref:hypothetical protein n=1 Tax=unclassified Streptomyces TaxID=2593676 RepID=UPI00343B5319